MSIDDMTVRHIARLARIQVDDVAVSALAHDMSRILDFIAELNALDTRDVLPMTGAIDIELAMREDVVTDGGYPDVILGNAPMRLPSRDDDYFAVPKVIE